MNTQYNKAVVGGVAAAAIKIVVWIAASNGIDIPGEVELSLTTLLIAGLVYAVPNKLPGASSEPEQSAGENEVKSEG